jgi:hypothetical protein
LIKKNTYAKYQNPAQTGKIEKIKHGKETRQKKKKTRARERGKEIMFSCRWF